MKPITFALPVGCGLLAWSIGGTVLAEQAQLQINFSWAQTESCTTVSPEIHVSSVPEGTKKFEIALQDLDVPTYHHGGGTVPANAGGDIPTGALNDYNGPCPPSGSHTYRFTVNALDANGNVIGTGSKSAPFPSN